MKTTASPVRIGPRNGHSQNPGDGDELRSRREGPSMLACTLARTARAIIAEPGECEDCAQHLAGRPTLDRVGICRLKRREIVR